MLRSKNHVDHPAKENKKTKRAVIKDTFCFFGSGGMTSSSIKQQRPHKDNYQPYTITNDDVASITKNDVYTQWEPDSVIRYSFKLPDDRNVIKKMTLASKCHDTSFLISELSLDKKDIIKKSFSLWQEASTLRFVEDDSNYHYLVFGFHSATNVLGYSDVGKVPLGKGTIGFSVNKGQHLQPVAIHEIGHAVGLRHPFARPFAQKDLFKKSTHFSVMNYNDFKNGLSHRHYVYTPLPSDYRAIQSIYGTPVSMDMTFHIEEYFKVFARHFPSRRDRTVSSLPLLDGEHTLNAENLSFNFVLDLRENGRSSCLYGDIYSPMKIKNVIAGSGINTIYLNSLDNIVNVVNSKRTILYLDPNHCGHDYVIGFNPKRDKIIAHRGGQIFHQRTGGYELREETLNCHERHFFKEKCSYTTVAFSSEHKISLLDVEKKDIDIDSIINDYADYLPRQLLVDFTDNFFKGAAISFIYSLGDELLDAYGCTPMQKNSVMLILGAIYVLYSGNFIANFVGTAVGEILLKNFHVNPNLAHFFGKTITTSINLFTSTEQIDVPGLLHAASGLIGNVAGNAFSFWCKEKMGKPLYQNLVAPFIGPDKRQSYHT